MRNFSAGTILLYFALTATVLCLNACGLESGAQNPNPRALIDAYEHEIRPLFSAYCFQCHGNGKKKGGMILDGALPPDPVHWDPASWLSAIQQIKEANMPPEEAAKQPTKAQLAAISHWLSQAVAASDTLRPKDPGFVALHRLNRTEYNNTISDLAGINFSPAEDFPADDLGYGFDNIADVLTLSPLLMERYLEAAQQILDIVLAEKGSPGKPPRHLLAVSDAKTTAGMRKNSSELLFYSNGSATFNCALIPAENYVLQVRGWQDKAGDEASKMEIKIDGKVLTVADVEPLRQNPGEYTFRFAAKKENTSICISFINDFYDEKIKDPNGRDRNLYVDHVELQGSTPAQKKVFVALPSKDLPESACAEKILKTFAVRAFRRPLKDGELESLVKVYGNARKDMPFDNAVGTALMAVLVSPHFLFRVESKPPVQTPATTDNPTAAWALNDYEIATRLSYFLWSTMPDEELFSLAAQHALVKPKIREEQVKRMLKDSRSDRLVHNFAGQWLELRNLEDISRDNKQFPMYNGSLADYMAEEATLFFNSVMRDDRSILTLVDADYTFVNEPLAKIYGIPNIKGDEFQRVTLKDDRRGGVITMGCTLTLTANPGRTSPVKRGKWVLDHILGTPPPPPPPAVPPLPESSADTAAAPLRERLERHRKDPNCAVCHNRMDGIGFSLENFDSIGRWREKDGKYPIDAKGTMPGVEPFTGGRELKNLILKEPEVVVRNFVTKMLTYALGRGVKPYDRPTLNEIMRNVEQNDDRFSSVILGIVNSDAFLKRRERRGDE